MLVFSPLCITPKSLSRPLVYFWKALGRATRRFACSPRRHRAQPRHGLHL